MSSINVRIPDSMKDSVEDFCREHHYKTKSEFVRELIRDKIEPKKG